MLDTDIDERERLRRANQDLAACLTLPVLWAGREPRYIVTTLLDVLVSMLGLELAGAVIRDAGGAVVLEAWRPPPTSPTPIARVAELWLVGADAVGAPVVHLPGVGDVRLARAPLSIQSGGGVVVAASLREDFPSERDAMLLRVAVTQAAVALNTADLMGREHQLLAREEAARREAEEALAMLRRLQLVTEAALSARTPAELLHDLLRRTRTALEADTATILLLDADQASLRPVASDGVPDEADETTRVPLGSGVAGRIAGAEAGVIIDDLATVEVVRPVLREGLRSLIGAPLTVDGRLIGVIHLGTVAPRRFTDDDLGLLRLVAERAALAIEHARLDEAERATRVRTEMAEEHLRLALEAGRLGTWEWTITTGDVRWSAGLEAIHGLAPGSFPGTFAAIQQEIHPDDRDRVLRAIAETVEQGREYHVEYRIVRPDGAVRWVEGRGQLFRDAEGRPDRMVGVCADVTERKRADEKFQLAVEAAPTAMIIVDGGGTILFVNALTERLLGYARHEIIGRSVEQLVPPRFRPRHAEDRASFFADPRRRPMGAGRDLYALHKDGSEVPVEIGLSPVETADGPFVLAAVTDITARKQVEEERAQLLAREQAARREAEEANRAKDAFLAVLSHELRTPLTTILGWLRMLRTAQLDSSRQDQALETIERNTLVQARMIDDLLDVSRIAAGKMTLDRRVRSLAPLIAEAVAGLQQEAQAKGLTLEVRLDSAAGSVLADDHRLRQVLMNLLTNAMKYTAAGGRVDVDLSGDAGVVRLVVRDTGIGIDPELLPHVFERFRQADWRTAGAHGGLGLGLAIVREIVERHGGAVEARSDGLGRGAVFTVTLPRAPAAADNPPPTDT